MNASSRFDADEAAGVQAVLPTAPETEPDTLDDLVFDEAGLLPAIIQDDESGEVLMLAWMDREAVRRTLTTGRVTFWSRSRQEHWRKGDTSGHRQYVRSVAMDCDADTLLIRVVQLGAACHTGTRTCFDGRTIGAVRGEVER